MMIYNVTSSRGSSRNPYGPSVWIGDEIYKHLNYDLEVSTSTRPGASLEQLADMAFGDHYSRGCPPNSFVYFLGGYCDAVYRVVENNYTQEDNGIIYNLGRYEEVGYWEEEMVFLERMLNLIREVDERVKSEGLRPVFATIPPGMLERWNMARLEKGKTCVLHYQDSYEEMQWHLNRDLTTLNGYIKKINIANSVYTPYIAGTVLNTNKSDYLFPIFSHHKLSDGVHASNNLLVTWAKKMAASINKNVEGAPSLPPLLPTLSPDLFVY